MKFTIHFKDENGWPYMSVDQLMVENKDSLKIQNYALERFKDFSNMCKLHRQVTKETKEAIKQKKTPRHYSFGSLFHDIFTKEDNEKIISMQKEINELKQKLSKYEPSVLVTGC